MKSLFFGLIISVACNHGLAADGRWTEGFGQGNLEYFIDQDGMRLYIGCPTQDGSADSKSNIALSRTSDQKRIDKFTINVNGINFDGPFSADSRVDDNNFIALLENIRKGDAIVKFNGKTIKFRKSNAAKIIPVYGNNFSCNLS